jgi:hypothetical protein
VNRASARTGGLLGLAWWSTTSGPGELLTANAPCGTVRNMVRPKQKDSTAAAVSSSHWVLATATGSTAGAVLGGALITAWLEPVEVTSSPLGAAAIAVPRTSAALGVWAAGIGIMQSLILRRHLVGVRWWPLATIAGWSIAGALSGVLPFTAAVTGRGIDIGPLGFVAVAAVTVLAIGLVSGAFQWLILRRQVERSGRWVWTNAGGIALAVVFAVAILGGMRTANWLRPEDFPSAQSWGVAGAAIGVVYGVVSGLVLVKLLRPMPAGDSIAATTSVSDT